MPLPVLRSQRLVLVPVGATDLDFLAELNSDPAVMAHISGGAATREQTEAEWRRRLGERSDAPRGLGYWIGLFDEQPVGWWGLGHTGAEPPEGELGFRLLRDHWGRGLGAEGAAALLHHAFVDRDVTRVWAGTARTNVASCRTLTSVGLACTGEVAPGRLTFETTRSAWRARVL